MSRRAVRILLRGAGRILFTFLVVVVLLVGLLQTTPGKRLLTRWINAQQSVVRLGAVTGFVPGRMACDRIEVRDAAGAWLELRGVESRLRLRSLLHKTVDVDHLSVSNAALARWPQAAASPAPPRAPGIPALPCAIALRRVAVAQIDLPAELAGEPLALRLSGSATASVARALTARLELDRLGDIASHLAVRLEAAGDPARVACVLELDEARGGLLWSRLGTPDAGSLRVRMNVAGLATNLQGRLEADADGVGNLHAAADVRLDPRPEIDVSVSIRDGFLRGVPFEVSRLQASVNGPPGNLQATLAVAGLAGGLTCTGSTALAIRGGVIAVSNLHLQVEGVNIQAAGDIEPRKRTGRGRVDVHADNVAALAGRFDLALAGRVDATAAVRFERADPELDLDVRARNLALGAVELTVLETRMSGTPSAFTVAATGRVDGLDLAWDAAAGIAVAGTTVSGTIRRLDVSFCDRLIASEHPVAFRWAGISNVALGAFSLVSGDARLSGAGLRSADTMRLDLAFTNVGLEDLAMAGLTGCSGRVRGSVHLQGDLTHPEATGQLRVAAASTAALRARHLDPVDGELAWTYREGQLAARLQAHGLADVVADGQARCDAAWSLLPWRFALASNGAAAVVHVAAEVAPLLRRFVTNADLRTGGRLLLDLHASGPIAHPAIAATGTLERLSIGYGPHEARSDAPIVARWDGDGGLALEPFTLRSADAALSGQGVLTRDRVTASLQATNLPMSSLDLIGLTGVAGRVSGEVRLSGAATNPCADGRVLVTAASLSGLRRLDLLPVDAALDWALSNGMLRTACRAGGLAGVTMEGEAEGRIECSLTPWRIRLLRDDAALVRVRAAAAIAPLFDRLLTNTGMHAEGRMTMDLVARGDRQRPDVSGEIAIVDGLFENPATGTLLRDIRLALVGDRSALRVVEAQAFDVSGGSLVITGGLELDRAAGYPVALTGLLTRAEFLATRQMSAAVDGELVLSGPLRALRLAGRILPRDLAIRLLRGKPKGVEVPVVETNHPLGAAAQTPPKAPTWAGGHVDLDLRVEMPDRFLVGGRGLSTEWRGQLSVKGVPAQPVLKGRLSLARGSLTFLGRRFDLTSGTLAWVDRGPAEMVVDITAEARAAEVRAVLNVTGALLDPHLSLTSDPPLPPDEILSRILFGRGTDTITPLQAVMLANGIRELRGSGNASSFLERGREWLHVDAIGVTQAETEDAGTVTGVTVGKYLNDRIYVQGEKGLAGAADTITIDLELTPSLSLQTESSPRIREGIRLNWRRDY